MGLTTPKPSFDVSEFFPDLANRKATTVRLHPRQGVEPGIAESKLGGMIYWPANEPWLLCEEHNDVLLPILQLCKDDFPELVLPADVDLLQVLWCPHPDHAADECGPLVQLSMRKLGSIDDALRLMPEPREFEPDYKPAACRLFPERVVEFPSAFEVSVEVQEEIDSRIEDKLGEDDWFEPGQYQYLLSTAPGTKVGGHVHWIQDPFVPDCDCGRQMEHLLTIASVEYDSASYPRWRPVEEQKQKLKDSAFDAGLMLGDCGSLYLFVCRNCSPWILSSVFQCS